MTTPNEDVNKFRICVLLSFIFWSVFAAQTMVTPYLVETIDLSPFQYTLLQTVFFAGQMIGSLYFGGMCKIHGAKTSIMVAFGSQALHGFVAYLSNGFFCMLISRLACTLAHVPVALQAILSFGEPHSRAERLGKLGSTVGLGFAAGSLFCGIATSILGPSRAAFVGGLFSLGAIYVTQKYLPDDENHQQQQSSSNDEKSLLYTYLDMLKENRSLTVTILLRSLIAISTQSFTCMFMIHSIEDYGATALASGCLMVYAGIIGLLVGVYVLPNLQAIFTHHNSTLFNLQLLNSLLIGLVCLALFGLTVPLLDSFHQNYYSWPFMVAGMTIAGGCLDSLTAGSVQKLSRANALGLAWFVESAARVVAPLVAEMLMKLFGFSSLGCLILVASLVCVYLMYNERNNLVLIDD